MRLANAGGAPANSRKSERNQATRAALRYAFLPGIVPRIRRLGMNFGHFAYMLALIYGSCGLIPRNHPLMDPANIGHFGLRDVIATAANNLVLSRENIDRIAIFVAVLLAVVMIAIQLGIIALMMAIGVANAGPATNGFFETPSAAVDKDTALTFLQNVFGVPGFFNGKDMPGLSLASSFHQMLSFYSTAMMVIAVIIVLYYVFVVVAESAQSGTPFGRRFNGVYAPLRLVLALGLLVPLPSGLNAGQYAVLHVAKFGSGLATNAWNIFKDGLFQPANISFGDNALQAIAANMSGIGKAVFMNELCVAAYNARETNPDNHMTMRKLNDGVTSTTSGTPSAATLAHPNVVLVWTRDATSTAVPVTDDGRNCGAVSFRYSQTSSAIVNQQISAIAVKIYVEEVEAFANDIRASAALVAAANPPSSTPFKAADLKAKIEVLQGKVFDRIKNELPIKDTLASIIGAQATTLKDTGWGDAAAWYMALASANEKIYTAISNAAPELASTGSQTAEGGTVDQGAWNLGFFYWDSDIAKEVRSVLNIANETIVSKAHPQYGATTTFFSRQDCAVCLSSRGGILHGAIDFVFPLTSLNKLVDPATAEQLPMIKMVELGNEIVDTSMKLFGLGALGSLLEGASSFLGPFGKAVGGVVGALGSAALFIAAIGLAQGFILAYLLPLMPFIYFFFAMVEWVMGVAEAVINMPLWALAHLRIEGDGLPGPGAMQGYFVLFGLLLKPILIVFALIVGFIVFNAAGFVLNTAFSQALQISVDGAALGSFSVLAYMIVYTIICYNLAMVSFKMIDQVPAQAFRWLGQSNPHYHDGKPDPIGNLTGAAAVAGAIITKEGTAIVSSGSAQLGAGLGRTAENLKNRLKGKGSGQPTLKP